MPEAVVVGMGAQAEDKPDKMGTGKRQVWAIVLMVPGPDLKLGLEVGGKIRALLVKEYPELSGRLVGEIYNPRNGMPGDF